MESSSSSPADSAGSSGDGSLSALVAGLQQDRLWLLRQLDSGSWPQWRLDLAALERELGQLLDHLAERLPD